MASRDFSPLTSTTRPRADWQRDPYGGATFSPAATHATPPAAAAPADPFNMFDDPATNFLTQVIKGQIGSLSGPQQDPTGDGIMAFLSKQLGSLASTPAPTFSIGSTPGNSLLGDFITQGRQRITELNQAPFSSAEEAALKARTRNDLATQRDQAHQRIMEDASRRGILPSSGVVGGELSNLEGQTTAADAKNQNDLMLWIADQAQQRKNQAATIAQQLAGAGQAEEAMGLQRAGLNLQGQSLTQQASAQRQTQLMGMAGMLADMAAQRRGEARASRGDVLSLASLLAEIPMQRLATVASLLNGSTPNPGSIFGDVASLNNAQQNQQLINSRGNQSFLEGLGKVTSYLSTKDRGGSGGY